MPGLSLLVLSLLPLPLQRLTSRAILAVQPGRELPLLASLDAKPCRLLWESPSSETPDRAEGMAEWIRSLAAFRGLRHLRLGWLAAREVRVQQGRGRLWLAAERALGRFFPARAFLSRVAPAVATLFLGEGIAEAAPELGPAGAGFQAGRAGLAFHSQGARCGRKRV